MMVIKTWGVLTVLITATVGGVALADPPGPQAATIFNGRDLTGWEGRTSRWYVEDGQIVARATTPFTDMQFLWSPVQVRDFYLSVRVKLNPDAGNSGIQFRSTRRPDNHAVGYQADIGQDSWGRLYEEFGRGKIAWDAPGEKFVKPGDWNQYEILAVGPRIWTAINGHLSVAFYDPQGATEGRLALQLHDGQASEVRFAELKLVHNPPVQMAGLNATQLEAALRRRLPGRPVTLAGASSAGAGLRLKTGDVVVLTGGTAAALDQRHGYLETLLTSAHAGQEIRFRNLAWQADTVDLQQRPLNFAPWDQQLAAIKVSVVLAWFGQMESMAGPDQIPQFVAAYEKLLDTLARRADRIVLLSPYRFEKTTPPLPDVSHHNASAAQYVRAIRELARRRGYTFVDLLQSEKADAARLTDNGLHPTAEGYRILAERTAEQLRLPRRPWAELEPLRTAILRKNDLWFRSWRPTNWAFLGGDRMQVEFSHDPSYKVRTFPLEMQQYAPLIEQAETRIFELAHPAATPAETHHDERKRS